MKKIMLLLSLAGMLGACQTSTTSTQNNIEVKVEVLVQGKAVEGQSKSISVADGEDVLDAMKANYEIDENKGLITTIAGIESDKGDNQGRWWKLLINDQMSQTGASDVKLKSGDKITFDLTNDWN